MDRQRAIIGYLLVAAGSAMFSSKAIFIKLAYLERPDPLLMLAWRMAFALPVFLLVGAIEVFRRRKDGRPMPGPGAILGACAASVDLLIKNYEAALAVTKTAALALH